MSQQLTLTAPAKINLSLDITGKRPDGYHTLRSVFQTVGIYDTLTVTQTEADMPLTLTCNDPEVPCDERNLVWKAAVRLLGDAPSGLALHLEKQIPSQAGLGGGSSDCAAALKGIRQMCCPGVTDAALHAIAAGLGADVPFFLYGGTALCEGIGEIVTPLSPMPQRILVIAKDSAGVSTPEGYRRLDALGTQPAPATEAVLAALHGGAEALFRACGNAFDAVTDLPQVQCIREIMRGHGVNPVLSGSGAAVFGGCRDRTQAEQLAAALEAAGLPFVRVCTTV